MNRLKMYAVLDVKSNLFNSPHFLTSDGVAIRSFSTACEDKNTDLNRYPADFSLYVVGEFNIETGNVIPIQPKQLCNAAEFVKAPVSEEIVKQFAQEQISTLETNTAN